MRDATNRRRFGPLPTILGLLLLALTITVFVGQLVGYRVYAITTGSMTGTADAGSMVVARLQPTADLEVGDVITYVPPPDAPIDQAVTHRIVDIATNPDDTLTYTTKGDANQTVDSWTFQLADEQQLVMQTAVPHLGRPVLFLSDPGTRRIVIGVPALAIALLSLRDIVRIWRSREDEEDEAVEALPLPAIEVAAAAPAERPNTPSTTPRPRVVAPRPATHVLDLTEFPSHAAPAPRVVKVVRAADKVAAATPETTSASTATSTNDR